MLDVAALTAAGIKWPSAEETATDQTTTPTPLATPTDDSAAAGAVGDEGYSPNIREHAQQLGDQNNAQLEEQDRALRRADWPLLAALAKASFSDHAVAKTQRSARTGRFSGQS